VDGITAADVADLIGKLHRDGLARESIRNTRATLAMVLDHAAVNPNPARDKSVKLPRADKPTIAPPWAGHVEAVFRAVPESYRLPSSSSTGQGCASESSKH
jgi:hypothetical protein